MQNDIEYAGKSLREIVLPAVSNHQFLSSTAFLPCDITSCGLSVSNQASDEAVKRNFFDVLHLAPIKVEGCSVFTPVLTCVYSEFDSPTFLPPSLSLSLTHTHTHTHTHQDQAKLQCEQCWPQ